MNSENSAAAEPSQKRKSLTAIVVVLFCIALNFLIQWRNSPPLPPKISAPSPKVSAAQNPLR